MPVDSLHSHMLSSGLTGLRACETASKSNRKERREKIRFNPTLYMVPQACNPRAWEAEAGGLP